MRANEFDNPEEKFVDMFRKFLPLAMEIIGLNSLPKMVFEKEVESPDQPTFGQYVNNEHLLYVGLANRHPNDILRTVAHELVHYKQDVNHELNDMSGATGSPEENEAHQLAGIVMRHFNKRYPEFLKSKPIVSESWSEKYKRSIDCSHPKGFSQRAHCQGRKKHEEDISTETIRKVKGGYRLVSHTGKNLGTYPTHAGAEKRERQVQYFKHVGENEVEENFADGRNPQDKGDSARHGIKKGTSISQLKKIRSSDSASPRKKQLAHWQINMRQGRKSKN